MSDSTGRIEMEEWVYVLPVSQVVIGRHYLEDGKPKVESLFLPDQEQALFQIEETSIGSLAQLKGPTRYRFQTAGSMGNDAMVPGLLIQFLRQNVPLFHNDNLFQQIYLRENTDNTYTAIFWSDQRLEAEDEQDEGISN